MTSNNRFIKNYWPLSVFFTFVLLVIGSVLYYAPSWGLQDDFQNLTVAQNVWQSNNFWGSLWHVTIDDFSNWGMFRPVYYSAVVFTYHFLKDIPWFIYILVAVFNFCSLMIWGLAITNIFSVKEEYKNLSAFLFPLSFLIFTPIWNVFTHISFQEKLIIFFSGLSLYYLHKAYNKNSFTNLIPVIAFIILGILCKATAIHFAMACIVFAVLDLALLKYNKRISQWVLWMNTLLFILYYWFITSNLRGYAGQYDLSVANIINSLLHSPAIIKMLIALALIMGIWSMMIILQKKNQFSPLVIMFPLGLLSYLLVLAPWSFVNYLLSALTPYILAVLFPVYIFLCYKNKPMYILANAGLIILVLVSVVSIANPRYSKLAEIKQTKEFIISFNKDNETFFFPPPFVEAARAVSYFTNADVQYFREGVLDAGSLNGTKNNYLIVNDEAAMVTLEKVKVGKTIYQNKTWKIFQLARHETNKESLKVEFPENSVQMIKSYLRDL